jgi:hypothetical protein
MRVEQFDNRQQERRTHDQRDSPGGLKAKGVHVASSARYVPAPERIEPATPDNVSLASATESHGFA